MFTIRSLGAAVLSTVLAMPTHASPGWQASWYAAPQPAWSPGFALATNVPATVAGSTVREVLRLSTGGGNVRVVLSNRYGSEPLVVGAVRIARTAGEPGATSAIDTASDRALTFASRTEVTIPPGGTATSDPVGFPVAALERLTVSAWYPGTARLASFHWGAQQTGYIAPGNATAAARLDAAQHLQGRAFLAAVHVDGQGGTIVALGDSITDGNGSTPDRHRRWPDMLAERLAPQGIAVANAGISGARLLSSKMGVKAIERFDADVLDQPGVAAVVVLLGTNDIGWPGTAFAPQDPPMTAERLVDGYRALIARAHARGVQVIGGTLPPFGNALPGTPFAGYWTLAKETVRLEVNAWIRGSGEFDAVADFDAALRDPADASRLRPEYDSGDHLHPGDAGFAAMARTVAGLAAMQAWHHAVDLGRQDRSIPSRSLPAR
ncbi:SGNH/GDSL hydrolase family protein [Pseudoduganella umbonata]|uniref:Lysophospholipase L1-like esterase n=1 Tax=Pseudoduganella umbonata TaxID=864828 RepID=A0A4P8HWP9_9BURK|nr:SGNH/GDSL hydrolase family protein [Pseudoduganella umbonata]MBB3224602.1 lysophospholipase L1-like esterase [Pseudoduganella umbonata]QCP13362.1 SGNH/GDSL hydrolase family protein [Pseudoduganella umbonata]